MMEFKSCRTGGLFFTNWTGGVRWFFHMGLRGREGTRHSPYPHARTKTNCLVSRSLRVNTSMNAKLEK